MKRQLSRWRYWVAAGTVATLLVAGADAQAAGGNNARSLGMAGAYTAVARNLDAIDWNPANLALPSTHSGSCILLLPSFAFGIGNNAFSIDVYEKYNGKHLTESDKDDILDRLSEGLEINSDFQYDLLGLSVGRVGFKSTLESTFDITLTQAPFEFVFRGIEPGKALRLDDLGAEACLVVRNSITYAHPLSATSLGLEEILENAEVSNLSIGATFSHLSGLAYASLETPKGSIRFEDYYLQASGEAILKTAGVTEDSTDNGKKEREFHPGVLGSGFALDLGVAGTVKKDLTVGLSLMNLGGKITWSKDPREFRFSFSSDSLNVVKATQDTTGGDSLYTSADTSYAIDSFQTNYPTYLNLGAAYHLNPEKIGIKIPALTKYMVLAFNWRQGFSDGLGISKTPQISFGLENGLLWGHVPLRLGFALGGRYGTVGTCGLGLNLGALNWDVAIQNQGHITSNLAATGTTVATQFKFTF